VCKAGDCTLGARVRKTAGARSCCIPELVALKGLENGYCCKQNCILRVSSLEASTVHTKICEFASEW